ncbi:hypothetical protein YC2023_117552 [Brassica napus]
MASSVTNENVIGQAIDIGDIQVVPAQGGKETKKLELTLTDTELPNNDIALTTGSHEVAKTQGNKRPLDKWSTYPERSILDIIMATESDDENTEDTLTNIALSDRSSGQVSLISIESGHHMFVFNSTIKTKRKQ